MKREPFTFDGFEPANTTPVPDIVFDEVLTKLSGAELKVLLYIIRRTWGFKKATDAISLNQLQYGIKTRDGKQLDKGCGITRRDTIVDARNSLIEKRCIFAEKQMAPQGDHATTVYGIYFKEVVTKPDYPMLGGSHQTGLPVVSIGDYPWSPNRTTVVTIGDPQGTVLQATVKQQTVSQDTITPTESKREGGAFAPSSFLPQEMNENEDENPDSVHRTLDHPVFVGSSTRNGTALDADEALLEDEPPPTIHRMPAIQIGATNGHHASDHPSVDHRTASSVRADGIGESETPLEQMTSSARVAQSAPPAVHEDHERNDGATTESGGESRPSSEKPKRTRKKPEAAQLSAHEAELKAWLEELRGMEIDLSKREVTAIRSLSKKKGTDNKEIFFLPRLR